ATLGGGATRTATRAARRLRGRGGAGRRGRRSLALALLIDEVAVVRAALRVLSAWAPSRAARRLRGRGGAGRRGRRGATWLAAAVARKDDAVVRAAVRVVDTRAPDRAAVRGGIARRRERAHELGHRERVQAVDRGVGHAVDARDEVAGGADRTRAARVAGLGWRDCRTARDEAHRRRREITGAVTQLVGSAARLADRGLLFLLGKGDGGRRRGVRARGRGARRQLHVPALLQGLRL